MKIESKLTSLFEKLDKLPRIVHATGDTIPLPDQDGRMGEHLFVNLVTNIKCNTEIMLDSIRECTQQVLQLIERELRPFQYGSIVISFYLVLEEGTNIRIYRTRIKAMDLPSVRISDYTGFAQGEESHYEPIQLLLKKP